MRDTAVVLRKKHAVVPDMPCIKMVYRYKKASFHWSAAKNEERSSSR